MSQQTKAEMQKHLKARDMIYDLARHPALPDSIFSLFRLMTIDIVQVCKHGYSEPMKGCLEIFNTPQNRKKYKEEFDKEFKEYTSEELKQEDTLIRADVPYEKIYGEPWKPDHIEYWGELSFCVFIGKDFKNWHVQTNWDMYSAVETGGRSFEDMIINIGRNFFKTFGKFSEEDFLTPAEKENHAKEKVFFFRPAKLGSYLVRNPKYKRVEASEINRRWAKWYVKTEDCKKKWESSFKDIIAGKDPRKL
jgi:hypothetical protein